MTGPATSLDRTRILLIFILLGTALLTAPSIAHAQGFSVAFDRVEFEVTSGDLKTGSISVTNLSSEPTTLKIYAGDWVRIPGDRTGYQFDDITGNESRSFLDWMSFTPERMTLQPDEWKDVQYEIRVPNDPGLEGSYWGVIFIEETPDGMPLITQDDSSLMAVGINTVFRYAIQIYVTVVGTEIRDVTFASIDFQQSESGIDVTAAVENLGNIYMRPQVWLEVRDIYGVIVYTEDHIRQTLLPESTRNYNFTLDAQILDPGVYLVMVIADYDAPTLIAAQGRIEITTDQAVSHPGGENLLEE